MSGSERQNGRTENDDTGEHGTLSLPVLELSEMVDELEDGDDDSSRGFDPYNSGSFVLKK